MKFPHNYRGVWPGGFYSLTIAGPFEGGGGVLISPPPIKQYQIFKLLWVCNISAATRNWKCWFDSSMHWNLQIIFTSRSCSYKVSYNYLTIEFKKCSWLQQIFIINWGMLLLLSYTKENGFKYDFRCSKLCSNCAKFTELAIARK